MKNSKNGEKTLRLSWQDFATLLPTEVSKKVAEYAGKNITPTIVIKAVTGEVSVATPLFANLTHNPDAKSPIMQIISDEQKVALKAKGLLTWNEAVKMVNNPSLFYKLFKAGIVKFEERDGVLLTIPEADIIAFNTFVTRINDNHAE